MWLAKLRSVVRAVLGRTRMKRDMDSELQFHLDARSDDLVAAGLDRTAATRRARQELGDPLRCKEQGREARGLRLVDQLSADVRYGMRWLRRSPAFAAAAVVSIAVGIGGDAARVPWYRAWRLARQLKPGVSRDAAEQELDASFQRFSALLPSDWPRDRRLILLDGSRGRPTLQNRFGRPLVVLSGLAMAVLLLVCLNVANLMLARTAARRRELYMRIALGASRGRIVGQLLVETLLIAVTGGALGLILARWAAQGLASIAVPAPASALLEVTMDLRVLAFATILSVATGLVCGLSPAFSARRTNLVAALSIEGRQVTGGRLLGRKLLVAAQIALSFTLLVGAGLFARTLANLRDLDFGFETGHLLLLTLDPTLSGYERPQLRVFYGEVTERVATLPGVRSASLAVMPLLGRNSWGSGLTLDTGVRDDRPGPERKAVDAGYFSTVGTPIVAGRDFTKADVASGRKVAVVNEAFARQYFGGQALGRRIGPGGPQGSADFTVVGIARDGKYAEVRENTAPFWYVPYEQLEQLGQLTLHVRTTGDPETVAADVRQAITAIATQFHGRAARNLRTKRVECDEIWQFVGAKRKYALAAKRLYYGDNLDVVRRPRPVLPS